MRYLKWLRAVVILTGVCFLLQSIVRIIVDDLTALMLITGLSWLKIGLALALIILGFKIDKAIKKYNEKG